MDRLKDFIAKNFAQYAKWILMIALGSILTALGYNFLAPPPPTPIMATGWVQDEEAVQAFAKTLDFPVFADTPAGKNEAALPSAVYQWNNVEKAWGKPTPMKNQNPIGSCVAFGNSLAAFNTMAGNIVLGNAQEELRDICEEVTYAGARVDVGKGRIRGDGAVGAWAAKYLTEEGGFVDRGVHEGIDLSTYDPNRCRSWGNTGAPAAIKALAKQHNIRTTTMVKSWEEAKKALAQGYGIGVCSDIGFEGTRDANGVIPARGSWNHCMCLDGYHTHTDGKEYGHIQNSWGANYHRGPVGWGNPNTAGFWTHATTIDRMLKQNDSWAYAGVNGFKARNPDWFLQLPRPKQEVQVAQRRTSCFDSYLLCP